MEITMPNPFPGMNPYLEDPALWPGFHTLLIAEITRLLQPLLNARGYYANSDERVWLAESPRTFFPDVGVVESPKRRRQTSDIAVMEVDEPLHLKSLEIEGRERFLEIFDSSGNQLVTSIEVISPSNKSHTHGRELYLRKQRELRVAAVNLVEIDLLRAGLHVMDVPRPLLNAIPGWSYVVHIGRVNAADYEVYAINLREALPKVRIPLKASDPDVALDLQAAVNAAYQVGPYNLRMNYSRPPDPPLDAENERWAEELLRSKGLRQ
jgi:hypothetical protein